MEPDYRKLLMQSNKAMMVYGDLEVLIMLNMHSSLASVRPNTIQNSAADEDGDIGALLDSNYSQQLAITSDTGH